MNPVIHIEHLGPIRNAEITLAPLTIFTGESGLGKSYAALACFYLYEILSGARLVHYFSDRGYNLLKMWEETPDGNEILNVNSSDIFNWMEQDVISFIGEMTGNPKIQGRIHFGFAEEETDFTFRRTRTEQQTEGSTQSFLQLSCGKAEFTFPAGKAIINSVIFAALLASNLRIVIFGSAAIHLFESVILPPSRGALLDCISRPPFKAGIYDRFYDFKEQVIVRQYRQTPNEDTVRNFARSAIGGELSVADGEIFFSFDESCERLPLSAAASSVKELAPYLFLLESTYALASGILFEEPEAHLHPARQLRVADTFGYLLSLYSRLIITTHSDFLLKRINQLTRLGSLMTSNPVETTRLMEHLSIDSLSLIDAGMVAAYYLRRTPDGTTSVSRIDDTDGIPFTAFETVMDEEYELTDRIAGIDAMPDETVKADNDTF